MVRDRGFEPLTPSVSRKCSTTELTAQPESAPGKCLFSSAIRPNHPAKWTIAQVDSAILSLPNETRLRQVAFLPFKVSHVGQCGLSHHLALWIISTVSNAVSCTDY